MAHKEQVAAKLAAGQALKVAERMMEAECLLADRLDSAEMEYRENVGGAAAARSSAIGHAESLYRRDIARIELQRQAWLRDAAQPQDED